MVVNYSPTDPVAGASRATAPTEVTRWADYADTIADADSRITTIETATSEVYVGSEELRATSGAPSQSQTSAQWPTWLMDAASSEILGAGVRLPSTWATAHVDLYWSNAGAGSGDVLWRTQLTVRADGGSLASYSTDIDSLHTAPASEVLEVSRIASDVAVSAGLVRLLVIRVGGDATDTLANDAAVLGVLISKAS